MSDYWDELEKMEEERDAQEYAEAQAYKNGWNDALDEFRKKINNYLNESSDFADFVVTDGAIDYVLDEMKGAER